MSAAPGCDIETAVAGAEGYLPSGGVYRLLERAIGAGLIVADWADREHARLFTTGATRRICYRQPQIDIICTAFSA